jgi:ABC-type branched-subunit amino acid transport system substrate-binding protein
LSIAKQEKHEAVLRMVPDNDNQASVITTFTASRKVAMRVVILVDDENRTYSDGLSESIFDNMNKNDVHIISMRAYGNSSRFSDIWQQISKNKTPLDLIIFVGVSNNGLVLVDEMLSLGVNVPVLFTDGSAVDRLIKKAAQLKGDRWVLSSVTLGERSEKPTYQPIGKDAYELAKRIVDSCPGSARAEIYDCVKKQKTQLVLSDGHAGSYQFDEDGNNKNMKFHIYKIKEKGELSQVAGF